jgi:hypothetical protein
MDAGDAAPHSLHGPPEAAAVPGAMMNPHAGQRPSST